MKKKVAYSMSKDAENVYHFSVSVPEGTLSESLRKVLPIALAYAEKEFPPDLVGYLSYIKIMLGITEEPVKESEPS